MGWEAWMRIKKGFWVAAFLAELLFCLTAQAQTWTNAPKDSNGRSLNPQISQPTCGGFGADGQLQPVCLTAAVYQGPAVVIGTCPAGSFWDVGTAQCWSCEFGTEAKDKGW